MATVEENDLARTVQKESWSRTVEFAGTLPRQSFGTSKVRRQPARVSKPRNRLLASADAQTTSTVNDWIPPVVPTQTPRSLREKHHKIQTRVYANGLRDFTSATHTSERLRKAKHYTAMRATARGPRRELQRALPSVARPRDYVAIPAVREETDDRMAPTQIRSPSASRQLKPYPPAAKPTTRRRAKAAVGPRERTLMLDNMGSSTGPSQLLVDPRPGSLIATLQGDPHWRLDRIYPTGFLYLKRSGPMPYDLRIVPHSKIDPKHFFVLSCKGITHVINGHHDFRSLDEFERDATLFKRVKRIPFFRLYRKWKSFRVWRKRIRKNHMRQHQNSLMKKLFILDPTLRTALLELRGLVVGVSQYQLFDLSLQETVTVDDFQDTQTQRREDITQMLRIFEDDVERVLQQACEVSLDRFLVQSGFSGRSSRRARDHQVTFTERASMRTQCRKLARFIRMIDFQMVDTFLHIALDSIVNVLGFIEQAQGLALKLGMDSHSIFAVDGAQPFVGPESVSSGGKKGGETKSGPGEVEEPQAKSLPAEPVGNPTFMVWMVFETQPRPRLRLEPSSEDFRVRMDAIIFSGLRVVMKPRRLLTSKALELYVQPSINETGPIGDGLDVETMILQDEEFRVALDEITFCLNSAFQDARTALAKVEPLKEQYLENVQTLQQTTEASTADWDDIKFRSALRKYSAQLAEFQSLKEHVDINIIRINLETTKNILVPSPTVLLARVQQLIPLVTHSKTKALLDELSMVNDLLSSIPPDVESFVNIIRKYREVDEQMFEIDDRVSFVNSLFFLIEDEKVPSPPELHTLNFLLMQTNNSLKTSMTLVEDAMEQNHKKFSKKLRQSIPEVRDEIYETQTALNNEMIANPDADPVKVTDLLQGIEDTAAGHAKTVAQIKSFQEDLGLEITMFDELDELISDLTIKQKLWRSLHGWEMLTVNWLESPLPELEVAEMESEVQAYFKVAASCHRKLSTNPVATLLRDRVTTFKKALPIVGCLRAPGLQPRHWDAIHAAAGFEIKDSKFTMRTLMKKGIINCIEEIELIATEATNESVLQDMLQKVSLDWKDLDFEVKPFKDLKNVWTLGSVDEIYQLLDDSLVTISAIMGSRYVGAIRDIVEEKHKDFLLMQATLEQWLNCQKTWMYLEPIFAAPDIQRQLPNESKIFKNVTSSWKEVMKQTSADPNALKQSKVKGRREVFAKNNALLDNVQRGLDEYLQTKRNVFPRFYFISDDELLDILARAQDPRTVQPYLRKCFDNLVQLEFGGSSGVLDIIAMVSAEKEKVTLGRNLKARGNVEDWLGIVESRMRISMHTLIKSGVIDHANRHRREWVLLHKAQVVSTVNKIVWCRATEQALKQHALPQLLDKSIQELRDLGRLVRTQLEKLERKAIVALVIHDVHARDILEELCAEKVDSVERFAWRKQLRFYWERTDGDLTYGEAEQASRFNVDDDWQVLVRQSASVMSYGYEYEGASGCLVITPLTDRCWMTISGALHLCLGANPAGPAGTGKTESSKDLAKALAVQCIVFNCSDQINYQTMGKLFCGLSAAGAWTCLDEFNRIDIEVLSVVAQQLLQLQQARLTGAATTNFDGISVPVRQHHVIVTMNPGYAGRTELPDNLKVLFRPVAMMVPDYALIAEIMLFAEGFDHAKALSKKMVRMYKLASEQLSQQCHYDYGMRAVKSVLVMAGSLRRDKPEYSEDVVLIKACRDSNIPKFLAADLPLFHGIIGDLFPGVTVPYTSHVSLQKSLKAELLHQQLQPVPEFIDKVTQVYETLHVRFGIALVGPTGGGKTVSYQTLAATLNRLQNTPNPPDFAAEIEMTVLNPKAVTMGELYGEFNEFTQEWKDGLASSVMREYAERDDMTQRWTLFDGPVDALWIENMNTVLDDNMTLCLANSERIKLKPQMRCIFEVQDLEVASPATVSRLGVVYMTPATLGWKPYVQTWLQRLFSTREHSSSAAVKAHILRCFELFFPSTLAFVEQSCDRPIKTGELNVVSTLCAIFEAHFMEPGVVDLGQSEEKLVRLAEMVFLFSLVWSAGGSMVDGHRDSFSDHIEELLDACDEIETSFPSRVLVFDVCLDLKQGRFVEWRDRVPEFTYSSRTPFSQTVVPTVHTTCFTSLLERLLAIRRPCFLTGVTGTGKTALVSGLLSTLAIPSKAGIDSSSEKKTVLPIEIMFSANTKSAAVQASIEGNLDKKSRKALWGPAGRPVILFIDDINMPKVEEYGAQPPIELLRQLVDCGGVFDRSTHQWTEIVDITPLLAAAPPGGGRSSLTARFTRHFSVLSMPEADAETMSTIFGQILDGFLVNFPTEVRGMSSAAVQATIDAFLEIRAEMRPTPTRAHYTFNLRDVAKVIQGLLRVNPDVCKTPTTFVRLWIHESLRVFHDRLVDSEDQLWFRKLTASKASRSFHQRWSFEEIFHPQDTDGLIPPLMFGTMFRSGENVYSEFIGSPASLGKLLDQYLEEYNLQNGTPMDLVFFSDAIAHLMRVTRIISQAQGSALLVGVGGSGRQSLSRLAASLLEYEVRSISLSKGYGKMEFREDLKEMMKVVAIERTPIAFVFLESQMVHESFLEDVNSLLSSGTIPNLWAAEDLHAIIDGMRPVLKSMGLDQSRETCLKYFGRSVRENLHLVLCLSPAGDSFRKRLRDYPSLINCTTIDWFSSWPSQALRAVAAKKLGQIQLPSPEVKDALVEMCVHVHVSVEAAASEFLASMRRNIYVTPKTFLDGIALYASLLQERRHEVQENKSRLERGIEKLDSTNRDVEEMQVRLKEMQPHLAIKAKETQLLLEKVGEETKAAETIAVRVREDEAVVKKQQQETAALQDDAQRDLDRAIPALNAAVKALNSLDKKDITEMRGFANPPEAVKRVAEGVCILLGAKPDWDAAKKLMQDSQFMSRLLNYDKDNIKRKRIKEIKKYVAMPVMAVENVSKVSVAATSICMWIHAMVVYDEVAKDVEPKKKRLEEMNAVLQEANATLAVKQAELQTVMDRVSALKKQCTDTNDEKQRIIEEIERTKQRLTRAEKLTVGLADELVRWKETVAQTSQRALRLVGDVFLASAAISYYGAFTGDFRERLIEDWRSRVSNLNVPVTEGIDLVSALSKPVETRMWQVNGLPADWVSTDNALLVTRGRRWPLMIDPQQQAKRWIKKMEAKRHLVTTTLHDVNMLRTLETGVRTGHPLLLEDIGENLVPSLDPLLLKQVFKQTGRMLIRIGDNDVDYDDEFRLYMTTKLHNPHYSPEISIKVTVINFTVTKNGLEDQLLEHVVKQERPDVERRKNALVVSMAGDRQQLKDIENKILQLLSNSSGNILDDEELVNTLSSAKTTSSIIVERVIESERTEQEVNSLRDEYRPVAIRGALIYFVIASFVIVDPMYQYSLEYFIKLFKYCLENGAEADELAARLKNLKEFITTYMYRQVCRGLFERHKLMFSFLICCNIAVAEGRLQEQELSVLLRGGRALEDPTGYPPSPHPELTFDQWVTIVALDKHIPEYFSGLVESFTSDVGAQWISWIRNATLVSSLPRPWEEKLTGFRRALVVKTLRPDLGIPAMSQYIASDLGGEFTTNQSVSMSDVYNDTTSRIPCIFVLSPGADPTGMLLQFAEARQFLKRLKIISLGQGQGARAEAMIAKAQASGQWVLLQNCHLAKSWMPRLEQLVFELCEGTADVDRNFRLFLTSFPASYFPVAVLQNSIKMTNEPPQGIRANLARSIKLNLPADTFSADNGFTLRKQLLFSLAFFHANLQERRKFGPLGWNIRYEFNDSDIVTSVSVLDMFISQGIPAETIPWDALLYVTGMITYGGRVTDDWDRRCLMTLLSSCYTPNILEPGFKFSASGDYVIPDVTSAASVQAFVDSLPHTDNPEVFGMNSNADVAAKSDATEVMMKTIVRMQPRKSSTGSAGEISDDDYVSALAQRLEADLPQQLDMKEAGRHTFVIHRESGLMDSLATVLSQEMVKFNTLLARMALTLRQIQNAISGLELMSESLESMYNAFKNNMVPENWEVVSYASLKPLSSWYVDTGERITFMRSWLVHGRPSSFPLYIFFFPQGFLTGVLQNHARCHRLPINELEFSYAMLPYGEVEGAPADGVIIEGLHIQGGCWNEQQCCLEDARPREMFSTLPPIHFEPAANYTPNPQHYKCPVYKTTRRAGSLSTTGISTNYVVAIELPSKKPLPHWIFNGTAAVLNLND